MILDTPQKLARFRRMVSYMKEGNVLDIGCHRPNPYLKNATGVDILEVPKHKNYKKIFRYDINKKIPFKKNIYDNVLAGEIIEHLNDPLYFIKECYRILKPKGKLILTTPNVFYYMSMLKRPITSPNAEHIIEIPYYSLRKVFEIAKFKKIHIEGIFFVIPLLRQIIETNSIILSKIVLVEAEK